MLPRGRLLQIYEDIETRARATTQERAWWPCKRGCDTCCRRLADVPQLVGAEWELLREGLDALPADVRAEVDVRIENLATKIREGTLGAPIVCPMLDENEGACRVYAHRPAACRTYGFYVERGIGLHCSMVTEAVDARSCDEEPVLWGNQESVVAALTVAGSAIDGARPREEPKPLTFWASLERTTQRANDTT